MEEQGVDRQAVRDRKPVNLGLPYVEPRRRHVVPAEVVSSHEMKGAAGRHPVVLRE